MSVDLQVVFPQEVIQLTSIRYLQGVSPPSLDIIGQDFSSVDHVLINDVASPDIVVVSQNRLFAQIPDAAVGSTITSCAVISNRLGLTDKSILKFRISDVPSKVTGILRLVQVFLKFLLTTPGQDIFAPRLGASALKNIGMTFGKDQGGSIVSDFVVSVSTAQRQLLAVQARDPSIPSSERLLAAKVLKAGYNRQESALVVSLEITSQAGRAAVANLMV